MDQCNGICIMASELIEGYYGVVAYPHPDCELHGQGPVDREPEPTDGPDYHAEYSAWASRQSS